MKIKEEVKDMKNELEDLRNESFATIILKDYKVANKRLFILAMSLLVTLIISFGYIVYLLNDIQVITEEATIESESGMATYLKDSESGDIIYGKD